MDSDRHGARFCAMTSIGKSPAEHVATQPAAARPIYSAGGLSSSQFVLTLACCFSQHAQVNVSLNLAWLQFASEVGVCVHDGSHLWQVRYMQGDGLPGILYG